MLTYTPRFGLPQQSDSAVDAPSMALFNAAMLNVEQQAARDAQGTLVARPAAGKMGNYYTDTATNIVYRDNGTTWIPVATNQLDGIVKNSVVGNAPLSITAIAATTAALQTWAIIGSTYPQVKINANGSMTLTDSTNKSTVVIANGSVAQLITAAGTASTSRGLVVNAATGFAGTLLQEWQNNGSAVASLSKTGALVAASAQVNGAATTTGAINGGTDITAVGDLYGSNVHASGTVTATSFSGNGIIPVGTVISSGASVPPPGYLLCNGAAVARSTYAALYAVIGTTFGAGDGTATFNIPNLIGKFPVGANDAWPLGTLQGSAWHDHVLGVRSFALLTLTAAAVRNYAVNYGWAATNEVTGTGGSSGGSLSAAKATALAGYTDISPHIPPSQALNYFVKT